MSRKEERAQLSEIVEAKVPFITHHNKLRLVTALLDGGFRYNPTVLEEAADELDELSGTMFPVAWLKDYARNLEDSL